MKIKSLAFPKGKKPKKKSKTALTKKADALFSLSVRSIGYCEAEGKLKGRCGGGLQCCHIQGRSNRRLRWDRHNVLCMCAGHHRLSHTYPMDFIEFVINYFPEKWEYVMKHKNEQMKPNYEVLLHELERGNL